MGWFKLEEPAGAGADEQEAKASKVAGSNSIAAQNRGNNRAEGRNDFDPVVPVDPFRCPGKNGW